MAGKSRNRVFKLAQGLAVVFTSLWFSTNAYAAADKDYDYPDLWTKPGGDAPDKEVPGWLVNLGPTGARAIITENSFIVRYIFKDSPAVGKLNLGDEIVGVFGKPFDPKLKPTGRFGYDGPIMEFGQAIEKAEGKDGYLILNVKRGSKTEDVTINLESIGTFSPTFPINCKKSELLRARALKYFVDHPEADGACNTRSAIILALLSSEDPKHQANAKQRILRWATERPDDGTWTWPAAYQLITLGEYHLLTKDPSVLPAMKLCVEHLEKIQYKVGVNIPFHERTGKPIVVNGVSFDYDKLKAAIDLYDGGFGHGSPGGYGPMQYTTILAVIGWQLAERSGLTVTPARMDSAFKYIHYGTNASGALAYGSEFTFGGYAIEDPLAFGRQTGGERAVGKSGAGFIAHKLASERADAAEYMNKYKNFYKTAYAGLPNGHADGNLNIFWGFVGAGAADDDAILRTTMDYFKPWINMARCFDGSFVVQPNRHAGDDDSYYHSSRYNITGSMALAFGIGNPKLIIQGIQVSLPGVNPKALKGKADIAYKALVKKNYAEALSSLKGSSSDDAVAQAILSHVDVHAQVAIAKMEALEKAGDIASLHAELGKGQKMFGLLPSFKEKVARFETAFREEPWKLELKIEANYRQIVGMLRRNKSLAYVGDLERFAAKYPDSLYGKWAQQVAKEYRASSTIVEPQIDLGSIKPASSAVAAIPNQETSANSVNSTNSNPAQPVASSSAAATGPSEVKAAKAANKDSSELLNEFQQRMVRKLETLLAGGANIDVWISNWGPKRERYKVQKASDIGLLVKQGESLLPVPWNKLSTADRADLAKGMAKEDDVEGLLISAVMQHLAGKSADAELALALATKKDADAAKKVKDALAGR